MRSEYGLHVLGMLQEKPKYVLYPMKSINYLPIYFWYLYAVRCYILIHSLLNVIYF